MILCGAVFLGRHVFWMCCGGIVIAILLSSHIAPYHMPEWIEAAKNKSLHCHAIMASDAWPNKKGSVIIVSNVTCEGEMHAGRYQMFMKKTPNIGIDSHIEFNAYFFSNPVYHNPGFFDYNRFLSYRGISGSGYIRNIVHVHKLQPLSIIQRARHSIRQQIDRAHLSENSHSFLLALVLGDKRLMPNALKQTMSAAGLSHVIAISGLHVGCLSLIIVFACRAIFFFFPRIYLHIHRQKLAAIFCIPLIWLYIELIANSVSAHRAGIMITVYWLGILLNQRHHLLNSLCVAVVIILSISPLALYDISFQLSALAMIGIVICMHANSASKSGNILTRALFYLRASIIMSTVIIFITAPVISYYFHFISLWGILLNIIVLPLIGLVILPLIIMALVSASISPMVSLWFWMGAGGLISHIIHIADYCITMNDMLYIPISLSLKEVRVAYLIMIAIVYCIYFWRYMHAWILMMVSVVLIVSKFIVPTNLCITFFDLGFGNSTIVQLPNHKTLLIDAGGAMQGRFDIGKYVIMPALQRLGIRKIDYAILTHSDENRFNSFVALIKKFNIQNIWYTGDISPKKQYGAWQSFISTMHMLDVGLWPMPPKQLLSEGAVDLSIHNLVGEGGIRSMVIDLRYHAHRFLLMGNAGIYEEADLISKQDRMPVTMLHVGHYGANDASSAIFLRYFQPERAIISVGDNKYDFPHDSVLERLARHDIQVFRTDLDGAVQVRSDGDTLTILGIKDLAIH